MPDMRICIICGRAKSDSEFNEEHVVPEALGGTLVLNDVCTSCNSDLGSQVDSHLVDNPFIQMARLACGILNKDSRHPFQRGTLAEKDDQKVHVKFDPNNEDKPEIHFLPNVNHEENEEGDLESIDLSMDPEDLERAPQIINKVLRRRGLPEMSADEILERAVQVKRDQPTTSHRVSFHLERFKLGILKIAYEFTYYILGDTYISDPIGERLREAIKNPPSNGEWDDWYSRLKLSGSIGFADSDRYDRLSTIVTEAELLPENRADKVKRGPCRHRLFLFSQDDRTACRLEIMNVFEATLTTAEQVFEHSGEMGRLMVIDAVSGEIETVNI